MNGIEAVVGPFGNGISSDNSERLISFWQVAGLRIEGSCFKRSHPQVKLVLQRW